MNDFTIELSALASSLLFLKSWAVFQDMAAQKLRLWAYAA